MTTRHTLVPFVALGLILGACSTDHLPTTPAHQGLDAFAAVEDPNNGESLELGLCKTWLGDEDPPVEGWTFEYEATENPTSGTATFPATGDCKLLGSWPAGTEVTVTEIVPDGVILELILIRDRAGQTTQYPLPDSPAFTVNVSEIETIWFKNNIGEIPPPPPPGIDGCTPGFWRQAHHFDYWIGYSPEDAFADVFGVSYPGTLLEGVWARGGGADALARHAVAALLNATSPDVDYALSESAIIAAVQAAFAGGNFEPAKDLLEGYNEQGCTVEKESNGNNRGGNPNARR